MVQQLIAENDQFGVLMEEQKRKIEALEYQLRQAGAIPGVMKPKRESQIPVRKDSKVTGWGTSEKKAKRLDDSLIPIANWESQSQARVEREHKHKVLKERTKKATLDDDEVVNLREAAMEYMQKRDYSEWSSDASPVPGSPADEENE